MSLRVLSSKKPASPNRSERSRHRLKNECGCPSSRAAELPVRSRSNCILCQVVKSNRRFSPSMISLECSLPVRMEKSAHSLKTSLILEVIS